MLIYRFGKVVHAKKDYILFESGSCGFDVRVNSADNFEAEKTIKLFIYEYRHDFETTLYGFTDFKSRILFADLIGITGVGPRSAMTMLSLGWEALAIAIAYSDVDFIEKFPYISKRIANNVIFELNSKWKKMVEADDLRPKNVDAAKVQAQDNKNDLEISLRVLGYGKRQIQYALERVEDASSLEEMVERAIIVISQAPEFRA